MRLVLGGLLGAAHPPIARQEEDGATALQGSYVVLFRKCLKSWCVQEQGMQEDGGGVGGAGGVITKMHKFLFFTILT